MIPMINILLLLHILGKVSLTFLILLGGPDRDLNPDLLGASESFSQLNYQPRLGRGQDFHLPADEAVTLLTRPESQLSSRTPSPPIVGEVGLEPTTASI